MSAIFTDPAVGSTERVQYFYNDHLGSRRAVTDYARYYDAFLGRFITEDPARNGNNWFVYCSNNPLKYIDPTGLAEVRSLRPHDSVQEIKFDEQAGRGYANQRDAAIWMINEVNPVSIKENREYSGLVYQDKADRKYYSSTPGKGSEQGTDPRKSYVNPDDRVVGDYHTHADYAIFNPVTGIITATHDPLRDSFDSNNFSKTDKTGIEYDARRLREKDYRGYLGTPSGEIKEYNPYSKKTYVIW